MPHSTQTFRLFVSSTFSDLKEERNALQEQVFPKLRKLCEEHGCRFQAIDLRWGVSEEAGFDNKTMQICFEEIDRCKRTTPKPNFLVLLGDRYGWRPLPEVIPSVEFGEIEQRITDAGDKSLLHRWYKRDDNNVPPVYILQPREGEYREYSTWVNQVETPLHSLLERITSEMDLSDEQRIKYTRSATEQEIVRGALSVPDAEEHVFCYFRDISDLEKNSISATPSETSQSQLFIDLQENHRINESSRERIHRLKDQLTSTLPKNIRNYRADWKGNENIPITLDHIPQLCADVETDLTRIIKEQIDTSQTLSPLYQEIIAHEMFAEDRAKFFIGREDILTTIREYIAGPHSSPLVIYGASGSGKSALMAKAWEESTQEHPDAVIISRFIGATPSSTDIRALLESLCTQIRDVYGDTETPVPSEYNDLVKAFPEWLQKASADRHLLLFLDALDQLNLQNNAHRLNWLPGKLPPHVFFIISVMDREGSQGDCLQAARDHLPPDALKQLTPLTSKEGTEILDVWLVEARRILQPEQREDILRKFEKNGLPLYLKLAFEEAKRWRSYDALPCGVDTIPGLAEDIPGIIRDLFGRLEHPANHGPTLVSKALGYLIAAKNGLTEDEMLDILSLDKEVMNKRSAFWPDADRLPVILWSRLYFDLEPYLSERSADHTSLLSFYHRQLREIADERYISGDKRLQAHAHLGSYFDNLKNWQKMVPLYFTEDFSNRIPMYRKVSELAYQLAHSRQCEALYKTLSDFDFIDAKTAAFGPADMITEYNLVFRNSGYYSTLDRIHTDSLFAIMRALQLSSNILMQDQSQLACQLYARLKSSGNGELESFCDTIRHLKDRPWLRQVASTLDKTGGELILTFCGHTDQVLTVAVTPDGKHAVSGSKDQCLKVWDLESGCELATFKGHTSYVTTVAVTPDGKRAVSGSRDKTMKIWDLESGRLLNTLIGHTKEVTTVAVTPDGRRAVSGSEDNTLKIWDLESGSELATLSGHSNSVLSVAITPDGRRAVSGARESSLKVWDIESGRELATLKGVSWNAGVAVTPDGKRVVSGSWNNKLTIWDLIHNCEIKTLWGHTSWVKTIAVTPDGRRAVSGSDDNTLKIWDLESCLNRCNDELYTLTGHTSEVTTVAVTPDGRRAVSGSRDNTLKVWNLEYKRELNTFTGHTNEVISVAVTPDGRRAVSGSRDNTLKVWDLESGRELHTLSGYTRQVTAVAVRLNGKHVVSGSRDNTLKVWDLESGQELKTLRGHTSVVEDIAVIPGGIAVSGSRDKTLKVWDLEDGQELVTLTGHTSSVSAVAVTLDGQRAVSGSRDKTLKIWDIHSGRVLHTLTGHTSEVTAVAVTSDGRRAVSGSRDNTLKVWDLESGQELHTLTGHSNSVLSVAVTPDGKRIISGSEDNTLKIWDLDFGLELATLSGHTHYVAAVAVTPNGKCVVSGSWDKTLKIWSLESGWKPAILTGHNSYVAAIAVTPYSKRAVSGSYDNILKVWDLESGRELVALTGHTSFVNAVAITPDGHRAVSGSDDNTLRIWDLESGRELHTLSGHMDEVTTVLITPDGDLAISGSKDKTLKVWDLKSGRELHTLSGHMDEVTAIAVTPDGVWVISGSKDTTLKVWDLESGRELHTLSGHMDEITAIAVTPYSERAVSGSKDQFLIVWDLESGKELHTLSGHIDEVTTVLITPDGERAISGSKDKTLKVWDLDFVWDFSTLKGHTNSIYAINIVAITSDGKRAVTGPGNTTLIVWDLDSKKLIATFSVDRAIVACCYSHVVNTIVAGDDSGGMYFLVPENL